jgi:hypothetical protein
VTGLGIAIWMVNVNGIDCIPSIVKIRLLYVPAIVETLPVRVNIPVLLLIVTCSVTCTPDGKFWTVTG